MRRRVARALGLTRLRRLAQRRRGRARNKRHHPALARPFLQSTAQRLRQSGLGAFDQGEGDAALLETRKAHVPFKRLDQLNIALGARKRDDVVETREPSNRRGRRSGWGRQGWRGRDRSGAVAASRIEARGPPPPDGPPDGSGGA